MTTARSGQGRLAYFDNMKGILIILVVFGHFLSAAATGGDAFLSAKYLFEFVYSFHMPAFLFISGLFSKGVYRNGRFRWGVAVFDLAVCWLMYSVLWTCQWAFGAAPEFSLLTLNSSMPWFLMVLCLYTLMIPLFARMRPAVALVLAFALSAASGFVGASDVLSLNRLLLFLPYFLIGYYLDPRSIIRFLQACSPSKLAALRVAAALAVALAYLGFTCLDFSQLRLLHALFTAKVSYAQAATYVTGATVSACFCLRVASFALACVLGLCVIVFTPQRAVPALTRTGERSLQVYVFHAFVSYAVAYLGLAALAYGAMPSALAGAVMLALSAATAVLLSWPGFPQDCFGALKRTIERVTA